MHRTDLQEDTNSEVTRKLMVHGHVDAADGDKKKVSQMSPPNAL